MTIDTLRAVRGAKPFRPFEIHTGSGESYTITHPEIIAISPDGETAVVFPGPGQIGMIDIASITEIMTFPSARKIGPNDQPDLTA